MLGERRQHRQDRDGLADTAACNQIKRPVGAGRGVGSMPRRSRRRPGCSLPRRLAHPQHQPQSRRCHCRRGRPHVAPSALGGARHSWLARSAAAVSAAPMAGTASCQASRRSTVIVGRPAPPRRGRTAESATMPSHVGKMRRRVVCPGGAGQHRHAGHRGELRNAWGGDPARAARTVRGNGDDVVAGETSRLSIARSPLAPPRGGDPKTTFGAKRLTTSPMKRPSSTVAG